MSYALSTTRDVLINSLLNHYNIQYTAYIYNLITFNGLEFALTLIFTKLGFSKYIILLIIGFLL